MGAHQAHEFPDLSSMALQRRIASLETIIENMEKGAAKRRSQVIITPWRVLNCALVLVLGAYKATTTYLGQTTGPTTADWIIGVVWALIAYWVSFMDDPTLDHRSWFFTSNLSGFLKELYETVLVMAFFAANPNAGIPFLAVCNLQSDSVVQVTSQLTTITPLRYQDNTLHDLPLCALKRDG
ncbi:hypothetical protein B0H13DRAFT_2337524 [Mycena leptocephala]|nr:hypothetical protein B0H13DRAFT_2337524 [Mycena leptocephala]